MNCQDFQSLAGDLARGVLVDVRAREEARAHEAACAPCAARVASERALTEGLRGLAASAATAAAPPRVEANLLAAFRAQAAGAVKADEKVLPFARPAAPKRWSWMKTAAASATAAAAAVALFVLFAPKQSAPDSKAAQTPPDAPIKMTVDNSARHHANVEPPYVPPPTPVRRAVAPRASGRMMITPAAVRHDRGRTTRPAAAGTEIATSFIPLTQDAALAAAEGGQVVRVELPRTALERFGLPMNVERADERVKADLLLGHDGVARAIRFVR
jgi:hypothetical protein